MHSIALWPTVAAVSIATLWDICCRRIPNWLVLPFGSTGLIASGVIGHWHGLQQSLLGILLGAVLMGVLYWLGGMGMGDVKLCAAIGAWIGPSQLGLALVVMAIAGGIMAFLWAVCGGFLLESLDGVGDLVFGMRKRGFRPHETLVLTNQKTRKLPYAPAIAVGVLFSFLAVAK
ncbi:MAG: A24 family peptidase [Acidobacteriota bacterium]|nr:A24 family peptidase [Acidobacteriota bacterium]